MAGIQSNNEQEDVVEKPVIRTLCRQSSVEMRMYPQQDDGTDSDEEKNDDSEDEESAEDEDASSRMEESDEEVNFRPSIVNAILKKKKNAPPPTPPKRMSSLGAIKFEDNAGQTHAMDEHQPEPTVKDEELRSMETSSNTVERRKVQFLTPTSERSQPQFPINSQPHLHEPQTSDAEEKGEKVEVRHPQTFSVGTIKSVTVQQQQEMASLRPKSPRPGTVSGRPEKEESFWEKIGTLGRKKRIKEVQGVQDEGKHAIDSPGKAISADMPPEEYALDENEERSMITPQSLDDRRLKELLEVLIEWINDELAQHRIIVKNIEEDLYDGQVLHKLIETLTGEHLDVPEVTQSEEGQRQKLNIVLATANKVLGLPRWSQNKWSVESIHSKNLVAILHLLVALARHFRAPVRLPERVAVQVVVVQKVQGGALNHRVVTEEITSTYDDLGLRGERDAFDTLFDHAPDKLQVVKKSLVTFVNKHLNKLGLEVTDLDNQFHDGVYLSLLMGLLEGFFVPLYAFHNTPHDFDQKVHNVNLAFDLMQEVGLARPKARPEDIVNLDLKSTLRVLYNLFTKYKNLS